MYSVPIGELQGSKDREMLTQQHAAARPRKARSEREKETPRMGRDALHAPCYTFRCCAAPSIRDRYFYPQESTQRKETKQSPPRIRAGGKKTPYKIICPVSGSIILSCPLLTLHNLDFKCSRIITAPESARIRFQSGRYLIAYLCSK